MIEKNLYGPQFVIVHYPIAIIGGIYMENNNEIILSYDHDQVDEYLNDFKMNIEGVFTEEQTVALMTALGTLIANSFRTIYLKGKFDIGLTWEE